MAAGYCGWTMLWRRSRLPKGIFGTGAIEIHDPKALLRARLWYLAGKRGHRPYVNTVYAKGKPRKRHRPQACVGCHGGCRGRYEDGIGNEVICAGSHFYKDAKTLDVQRRSPYRCLE